MVLWWILRSFWDWERRTWAQDWAEGDTAHPLTPQHVGKKGSAGTWQLNWDLTWEVLSSQLSAFWDSGSQLQKCHMSRGGWEMSPRSGDVPQVREMCLSCSIPWSGFIPGGFQWLLLHTYELPVWDKCGLKAKNFVAVENFELFGGHQGACSTCSRISCPFGMSPAAFCHSQLSSWLLKQAENRTYSLHIYVLLQVPCGWNLGIFLVVLADTLRVLRSSCPGFWAPSEPDFMENWFLMKRTQILGQHLGWAGHWEHFQEGRMQQSCSGEEQSPGADKEEKDKTRNECGEGQDPAALCSSIGRGWTWCNRWQKVSVGRQWGQ